MATFCTDEDVDARLLAGITRRWPEFDFVRAVDVGLGGRADPEVLEWAAREGRVLLTHDARTMIIHAMQRLRNGLPMPGVVVVPQALGLRRAIEELEILLRFSKVEELESRVIRLPL